MTLRRVLWAAFLGASIAAVGVGIAVDRRGAAVHFEPSIAQQESVAAFIESRAALLAPLLREGSLYWDGAFRDGFIRDARDAIQGPNSQEPLVVLRRIARDGATPAERWLALAALHRWAPPKLFGTALSEAVPRMPRHLQALTESMMPRGSWPAPSPNRGVFISEFLASNAGAGPRAASPDWIELHNSGAAAVDLEGWYLTDDPAAPKQWPLPAVELAPGAYLRIWASGRPDLSTGDEYHTNFRLNAGGEWLALVGPSGAVSQATAFYPFYPPQRTGVSYGVAPDGTGPGYFRSPTPGAANTMEGAAEGITPPVQLSRGSGYCGGAFRLTMDCASAEAVIRYTVDGSTPDATAAVYEGPIPIDGNTVVRAVAKAPNRLVSEERSGTYLFLDEVLAQEQPEGWPGTWGADQAADYAMDPEIAKDPTYRPRLRDGLRDLPLLSVMLPVNALFDPERGIYANPMEDGLAWERPARLEFTPADRGEAGFAINCGLRIQGRSSRQPRTTPKHSFRAIFRAGTGAPELRYPLFKDTGPKRFNTLVLRATSNHSWLYPVVEQREKAQYIRDLWTKDTQRSMGQPAPRCRYVHLFLNGVYWGVYAISERPDAHFMAARFGGSFRDYDVRKGGEVVDGSDRAWRTMMRMVRRPLNAERYEALQQFVDVDSLIDYLILNHYAGNDNWDFGNWYAARPRDGSHGFRFFAWDAENTLKRLGDNKIFVNHRDRSTELFHELRDFGPFRERFAERLERHLTGDGALTPERAWDRFSRRAAEIDRAIIAESARWGDYRRDVEPYRTGPFALYTRDTHWLREQQWLGEVYFPQRTAIVLEQYENAGLYPPGAVSAN